MLSPSVGNPVAHRDLPPAIRVVTVAAVGLLVALLYTPVWGLVPGVGLDPGWRLGLSWAFDLGYSWGSDIEFTYGPLGWTFDPMAFAPDQVAFALALHVVAAVLALAVADMLAREQLRLPRWPALAVAILATALSLAAMHATLVLALFLAIALLDKPRWWLIVLTGLCLGVLGHQKLSEAVIAALFAFLCALGSLRWRGVAGLALVTLATWVGLWLLLGQDPGALADHLVLSFDFIAGFAAAQARPKSSIMWQHVLAAILVLLLAWQAFEAGRSGGRRRRTCLLAATVVASIFMLRAGFTRHDDGHLLLFVGYVIALGTALVLGTPRGRRHWIGVGAIAIAFALQVWITPGRDFVRLVDRSASLDSLSRATSIVIDDGARESLLEDARASLLEQYAITPEIVVALQADTVLVDPWDVSAAWAADADWRPVPLILPINAVTPRLDRLHAENLKADPRLVLQSLTAGAIDGRNPDWDTPAYRLLLYCDYTAALTADPWLVLRPGDTSRCGQVLPGETHDVEAGEEIAVPQRPGALTLATIRPSVSPAERLLSLLGLPTLRTIDYGGTAWRWPFGEAAERIILNDPIGHPTLRSTPALPYPTISLSTPATITFETMDVAATGS